MRELCVFMCCFCLFGGLAAQPIALPRLEVTTSKTTIVVSHYSIRSVDRGSRDILVERVKGTDTLLEVKAARSDFPETNLTLLTGDGVVHMFQVSYASSPSTLRYQLPWGESNAVDSVDVHSPLTEADYDRLAKLVFGKNGFMHIRDKTYGVSARVYGIYIHDEALFLGFQFKNKTDVVYDVSQLDFYIRDKNVTKRTASQDLSQYPLFYEGDHSFIPGRSSRRFVVVLPKFTIPDKKFLVIVIKERNGGRLLKLRLKNSTLMRARRV